MQQTVMKETAMEVERGWSALQGAGFGVVLVLAVATLGYAALMGPQGAATSGAAGAVEEQAETATRSGMRVINDCTIQPHTVCAGADLSGADLSDAFLFGANLRRADLSDANLTWAILIGADLTDANLTGSNLNYADLRDADLTGADLTGADLRDADLTNALFAETVMPDGCRRSGSFVVEC